MVGRCIPYWNGHFFGDLLVFREFRFRPIFHPQRLLLSEGQKLSTNPSGSLRWWGRDGWKPNFSRCFFACFFHTKTQPTCFFSERANIPKLKMEAPWNLGCLMPHLELNYSVENSWLEMFTQFQNVWSLPQFLFAEWVSLRKSRFCPVFGAQTRSISSEKRPARVQDDLSQLAGAVGPTKEDHDSSFGEFCKKAIENQLHWFKMILKVCYKHIIQS